MLSSVTKHGFGSEFMLFLHCSCAMNAPTATLDLLWCEITIMPTGSKRASTQATAREPLQLHQCLTSRHVAAACRPYARTILWPRATAGAHVHLEPISLVWAPPCICDSSLFSSRNMTLYSVQIKHILLAYTPNSSHQLLDT